jgi:hypothetical protein
MKEKTAASRGYDRKRKMMVNKIPIPIHTSPPKNVTNFIKSVSAGVRNEYRRVVTIPSKKMTSLSKILSANFKKINRFPRRSIIPIVISAKRVKTICELDAKSIKEKNRFRR